MTTEYSVRLDQETCEGVFACLVRDDRFAEAANGLATIDDSSATASDEMVTATFRDGRFEDARQAATACPTDAITVQEITHE